MRTDGLTDMTNLTVAFGNFAKAPKTANYEMPILQAHNKTRIFKLLRTVCTRNPIIACRIDRYV